MRLITEKGMRLDRPVSGLDQWLYLIKHTRYQELSDDDKADLVILLHQEHQKREAVRWAPIQ